MYSAQSLGWFRIGMERMFLWLKLEFYTVVDDYNLLCVFRNGDCEPCAEDEPGCSWYKGIPHCVGYPDNGKFTVTLAGKGELWKISG